MNPPITPLCSCTADNRCAAAWLLRDAYKAVKSLNERINIGHAYTYHLRQAGLLTQYAAGTEVDPRSSQGEGPP